MTKTAKPAAASRTTKTSKPAKVAKPTKTPKTPKVAKTAEPVVEAEVSPQRIARRERRRERSREEIVTAARRVLLQKGLAATTLDAIANEVGLTKAALYYYYPSKDALFFEIMYGAIEAQVRAVHDAVDRTETGGQALGAIVRETVHTFAARLDDFRVAFMLGQVSPGAVRLGPEQFARLRPLNDLAYAGTARRLTAEWNTRRGRAKVEPRMMAFLANLAAVGLLTMKGLVESFGDPLIYSDDELIEAFARLFEAGAEP